ncbi:MAG: protease complex subunit PrcB family protein [Balneolaceae bacterium]
MKKLIVLPLFLFFAFACSSSTSVEEERSEKNEFFENADTVEFETISQTLGYSTSGSTSFEENQELIIETEEEFIDLWVDLHEQRSPAPDVPEIDFDNEIVIAVLMGVQNTGGYFTTIEEVGVNDGVTGINVVETSPGEGCTITEALTMPYHIITIPDDLPDEHEFFIERIRLNCDDEE